jgi:hypothetical protein
MIEMKHGSAFDRGAADSWYHRAKNPHKGGVGGDSGERIEVLTAEEVWLYNMGYEYNERFGGKKDWD